MIGAMSGKRPTPSLEFIIAARDAAATIGDTISCLTGQTRPDWGAIVVDDGSADGTAGLAARSGDRRVRVVCRWAEGVAAARNAGLALASAPVVVFLDADDFVAPCYVETMLGAQGKSDAVACGHWFAAPDGRRLDWTQAPSPGAFTRRGVLTGSPAPIGAIAVRRDALTRLLGAAPYREGAVEDWDLWLRFTLAGGAWAPALPEALFGYRLRPDSRFRRGGAVWRAGLGLLRGAAAGQGGLDEAERDWSLRRLAGAVAPGDAGLTREIEDTLGAWNDPDLATLASALMTAFPFSDCVGPREGAERAGEWLARAGAMLGERAEWARLEAMLDFDPGRWARLARALLARRRDGQRIVLYGMGLNGRALYGALRRAGASGDIACADDAGAPIDLRGSEARVEDLRRSDLVVVTPNNPGLMPERARARGVARVITLEELARESAAAGV